MDWRPGTPGSDSLLSEGNASTEDGYGDYDTVNVVVRVRRLAQNEKDSQAVQFPAEGQISVEEWNPGASAPTFKPFTFNVVFEPEAKQEDVFEYCGIKRLIDMALDGFSCTVLAYGQTGSGKTHTLTGPMGDSNGKRDPGIISLAFAYLFDQIRQKKADFVVQASFLEVYNEQVLDLLNPSSKSLPVRWSKDKGFYAENLFVVECEDVGDLEGVLEEGKKNRQVRSHAMNEHSSRSHSILVVSMTSEMNDPDDGCGGGFVRKQGKLCLVDLAGSEKTKKTNSKGEVLIQANNINKSLLVLGNCISSLADSKKRNGHIPFRDSTLTKLLADSISGSGMVLMIACVSPSRSNCPETINTLRYASRAKKIKTKPTIRMDPREMLIMSLKREVRLLRMENTFLRQQMRIANGYKTDVKEEEIASSEGTTENGTPNGKSLDGVVKRYMSENSNLREENSQLHRMREILIRDHELVCRENERLLRRLTELDRGSGHPLSMPSYLRDSPSLRYLNNVSPQFSLTGMDTATSVNNVSNGNHSFFKILPHTNHEEMKGPVRSGPSLLQASRRQSPNGMMVGGQLAPARIRNGRRYRSFEKHTLPHSLTDLPSRVLQEDMYSFQQLQSQGPKGSSAPGGQTAVNGEGGSRLQRRNSWGSSGIPLSTGRLQQRAANQKLARQQRHQQQQQQQQQQQDSAGSRRLPPLDGKRTPSAHLVNGHGDENNNTSSRPGSNNNISLEVVGNGAS